MALWKLTSFTSTQENTLQVWERSVAPALQHASNSGPLQLVGNGYAAPRKALEAIMKLDGKRLLPCY